jgi:hypothetical protein
MKVIGHSYNILIMIFGSGFFVNVSQTTCLVRDFEIVKNRAMDEAISKASKQLRLK